jgi:hypothetical protein
MNEPSRVTLENLKRGRIYRVERLNAFRTTHYDPLDPLKFNLLTHS